jgi:hypothetical protein
MKPFRRNLSHRFVAIALLFTILGTSSTCPRASAQEALTVVTAGLTLDQVLKEIESKAYKIIGRASEAASLAADAAARNALLALDSARDALNGDLTKQWDNLDTTKRGIVKELDSYVDKIQASLTNVSKLEELSTLDVDGLLSKIPFVTRTYAIKSVTGSQFYRSDGLYRFIVRSNTLDFAGRGYNFLIDGQPLDPKWISQVRQYEIELLIPASFLEAKFSDRDLGMVTLGMSVEVSNRESWEIWKEKTRWAYYKALIRLFPRFPVEYRLEEHSSKNAPDPSREEWCPSQVATIGGCGDNGCYSYHNVYAFLPDHTEATGRVTQCSDSFAGWGNFVRQTGTLFQPVCTSLNDITSAIEVNGTTVRMIYQQHSHDRTRNVSFKAGYHPLSVQGSVRQIQLIPIPITNSPYDAKLEQSAQTIAEMMKLKASAELKEIAASISYLGASGAASSETSSLQAESHTGFMDILPARSGFLQYGQPYEGLFSNDEDAYTLTAKDFAGNIMVVTESKSDPRLDVKITNLSTIKRIIVTPNVPW